MTIYKGPDELLNIAILAFVVFGLVVAYTKIVGLRSFAKMTSVDFATTIAVGSMIASVILPSQASVVGGCFGILMVYFLQWGSSRLKTKSKLASKMMENKPKIVMRNGEVFKDRLFEVNMTEADLIAKLREANVLNSSEVKAVVFESTGDVSVLHGEKDVEPYILSDV